MIKGNPGKSRHSRKTEKRAKPEGCANPDVEDGQGGPATFNPKVAAAFVAVAAILFVVLYTLETVKSALFGL
ncbi:MAG: hypothetical protein LBJ46_04280 [Planctomycetota bacterium]|nr:hypothetical protein [Planctomycetota bacterium]